ncbi:MAG: SMP-30/gluconolactonase/LRE family protein [Pseudomonadota bacterium]
MIDRRTLLAGMAALPFTHALAHAADLPAARIDRIDPALDRIIAPGAQVEILAQGYRWAEGPTWAAPIDALLFGDPPSNIVYRWTRKDGVSPFLSPSGLQTAIPKEIREAGLNGIAIDRDGHLVGADSGTRAIVRVDLKTRARTILADRYQGKRFNSPNDLTTAGDGSIYFSDPPYGLTDGDTSSLREIGFNGLYRLTPDGMVTLIDGSHRRPNGVTLSPDGRTLYLALSDEKQPQVLAYSLGADGLPTGQRLFRDMGKELAAGEPGLPDGIKTAPDGTVFATGPGGVHVCAPDGRLLGKIRTGKAIANCCIGEGGKTLFLTSADRLAAVPLIASGG